MTNEKGHKTISTEGIVFNASRLATSCVWFFIAFHISIEAAALRVFERKVLCKIFSRVRVGNDFLIQSNSELYGLLNDIDNVQRINIQRLH